MPAAQRITPELLRRRAEHNDGDLATVQEITLHQFDIEKIETIDLYCKQLKILYLQNNQITKLENLKKLKQLEYLNLALNNISWIENLEGCESLQKLDLTVNFIEDLTCIQNLVACSNLRELYLTGNPITSKPGYREYIIFKLPQLHTLDGVSITPTERIQARQKYIEILNELTLSPCSSVPDIPKEEELEFIDQLTHEEVAKQFQESNSDYSIKSRLMTARQLAKLRTEKESKVNHYATSKAFKTKTFQKEDGTILQCNQGKYPFDFKETPNLWILKVKISKYLDTNQIQVDLFEDHVKIMILNKLLQLRLESSISVERSIIQRSTITGELCLLLVKLKCDQLGDALDILAMEKKQMKTNLTTISNSSSSSSNCSCERQQKTDPFSLKLKSNQLGHHVSSRKLKMTNNENVLTYPIDYTIDTNRHVQMEEFEDDPNVPPLV